ncbi:uncharacterized protein LOC100845501 [Brachypodium distachyon]|uniref:Uncharacterized protein n=1 Tax=Brachypodium distachyon TaxID=15368 RepID=I1I329_BRADI|nr:uncharacterized protein LOC100845501 [Brachypodium distachyon]KQJ96180.1 hypothetical protein BRADI_3g21440v3 [Brachypodium distachyon]|eukprot:XP_003571677.2 uncharacterized protein LOC100845501 [Brachypodium distachyon]
MPGMVADAPPSSCPAPSSSSSAIWSRRRDEITFDRLRKFWNALSPQGRHALLRIDKQTLIEHARKNLYCSRCNGLLLESFTQIVIYGKSLHQESSGEPRVLEIEPHDVQDPSVHPWGGLSTTKDGILTLLDCFINAKSLHVLQNVFDNARAREREREMLYPDACGGEGRGWISPAIANYGRGHGTRDTCALHTARLSCDTLVDFWSALGDEARSSLLRMKEEDFIERLMHRFDSKRFCRDCRKNVIREFKELKELKRLRREPRCTSWFCVADTAFHCEVFEDAVLVDWHQDFLEQDGAYHHFELGVGTDEGKADILEFEDVGMNGQVHKKGLDLDQYEDYFVTLRAWRLDGRCTEFCVKAHALKGQSCVHRRLIVGDGFVTITKGESVRSFFEYAEEAEEEDEDDAMDRDGNDPDSDGAHPQKHAKSPELAREFLLDAATVIFKEQVEKAFREGTARQNAHSVFVSLALKLLEERIHVACKEIITLEKQTKLLEEEEKEKREEEERRERRRAKEREKKLRRKERLKEKGRDKEEMPVQSKSSGDVTPGHCQSPDILDSRYSASDEEGNVVVAEQFSRDTSADQSLSTEADEQSNEQCSTTAEFVPADCSDSFICEQSKSRRKPRFTRDSPQEKATSCWYEDRRDDSEDIGDIHCQSRERTRNTSRGCNSAFSINSRTRDRYEYNPCSCGHQEDYRYFPSARSSRDVKMPRKTLVEKPRLQYRRCYPVDSFVVPKGSRVGIIPNKNTGPKQVWEPMDARKKASLGNAHDAFETVDNTGRSDQVGCSKDINECEKLGTGGEPLAEVCSDRSEEACKSDTDQPGDREDKTQAACNDEPAVVNKPDSCLKKGASQMAKLTTSDSSSCLSEGDRDSSMSSMTSLSAQNAESSSSTSDSEESSERNNSSPGDPPAKNASRSLLEMCAGNGFREYQPKSMHPPGSNQFGLGMAPFQDHVLHHHKVQTPPYSSTFVGFHSHHLSVPTSGYLPYPQPGTFYPSPVGYSVTGNQCVDFPMQYSNNIHPYSGPPEFRYIPAPPINKTMLTFSAMPPTPLCINGRPMVMNPDMQHHHTLPPESELVVAQNGCHTLPPESELVVVQNGCHTLPPESELVVAQNGCSENNFKPPDDSTPFSLFQFNLPIAPPASAPSKDVQPDGGAMAAMTKPPMAQNQPCSREETDVKEYNLFSGCERTISISSFM